MFKKIGPKSPKTNYNSETYKENRIKNFKKIIEYLTNHGTNKNPDIDLIKTQMYR